MKSLDSSFLASEVVSIKFVILLFLFLFFISSCPYSGFHKSGTGCVDEVFKINVCQNVCLSKDILERSST